MLSTVVNDERAYSKNVQALIYVVDSADTQRMAEAREELHSILADSEMQGEAGSCLSLSKLPGFIRNFLDLSNSMQT